jgi:hypothetical protein
MQGDWLLLQLRGFPGRDRDSLAVSAPAQGVARGVHHLIAEVGHTVVLQIQEWRGEQGYMDDPS